MKKLLLLFTILTVFGKVSAQDAVDSFPPKENFSLFVTGGIGATSQSDRSNCTAFGLHFTKGKLALSIQNEYFESHFLSASQITCFYGYNFQFRNSIVTLLGGMGNLHITGSKFIAGTLAEFSAENQTTIDVAVKVTLTSRALGIGIMPHFIIAPTACSFSLTFFMQLGWIWGDKF